MTSGGYEVLKGSEHRHPPEHTEPSATAPGELITVTLIVRRRAESRLRGLSDYSARPEPLSRAAFAATHGAEPRDLSAVEAFARAHGLQVLASDSARRSVVVRGTARAIDGAFAVRLHDYLSPAGRYRGHSGAASVPAGLAGVVAAIVGLDSRIVPARHLSTLHGKDPVDKAAAALRRGGAGQTIAIFAMKTGRGDAGYTAAELADAMRPFRGLPVPNPVDVSVDGVVNSGVSDGETGPAISAAAAIAPEAAIAVYFTGGQAQSIIHALQRMIHPGAGDPQPTVISISYAWGSGEETASTFSNQEREQIDQLFGDAADLGLTVLFSPASEPRETIAAKIPVGAAN
jgi:kumamolisin